MSGSSHLTNDAPGGCAHCRQPFAISTGRVEPWRSSTGGYFCNEFCADDDEVSTWAAREHVAGEIFARINAA